MPRILSRPHSVSVILGHEAVLAYEKGELPQQALRRLGVVRDYEFSSIHEFMVRSIRNASPAPAS